MATNVFATKVGVLSPSHTITGPISGNANVGTVSGNLGLRAVTTTYTDNVSAAAATGNFAIHAFSTPTLTAANAITPTNLSTFYIQGSPTAGTNVTVSGGAANTYSLYVAGGNSFFNGNISANYFLGNGSQLTSITANVANFVAATTQTTGTYYLALANTNTTTNVSINSNTNINVAVATGTLSATVFAGSGASLTSLPAANVTGTLPNAVTNAISNVGTVSAGSIAGSLITGNVANATIANVANFHVQTAQTTGTYYLSLANTNTSTNVSLNANTNINVAIATGTLSATVFAGSGASLTSLPAANVTGTLPNAVTNLISNVGTIAAGTWQATAVGAQYGGTGSTSLTANNVVIGNGTSAVTFVAPGTAGNVLTSNGTNWTSSAVTATSATNAAALLQNTSVATTVYPTFTTSSANGNSQAVINTSITANLANASITATTFVGALSGTATSATTASNATNVSTTLTSTGTSFIPFISTTATGNYPLQSNVSFSANLANGYIIATGFVGNANAMTSIPAANVTGTLPTSVTNAISNIGTLTAGSIPGTLITGNVANATIANVANFHVQTAQTTGTYYLSLANTNTSTNVSLNANTNINVALATGTLSATLFAGSGASLTSLPAANVTGTLPASVTNAISNIGTLTAGSIPGTLVTGTVPAATTAGTVTTAAQPNITSVSTSFTSLTFANAQTISGNNLTLTTGATSNLGTLTGNWTISSGSLLRSSDGNASNVLYGNGSFATAPGASASFPLTSGASNINVASSGGNLLFTANGVANILTIANNASVGQVQIAGTLTSTGNANVPNLTVGSGTGGSLTGANLISANYLAANSITISGAVSSTVNVAATLGNLGIRTVAATYTDTAATGTQANAAIHYIDQPTITGGTNAKTYTNMSTFYIANVPLAGTNATITNSYALFVANGNSFFGGNLNTGSGNITTTGNITGGNIIGIIAAGSNTITTTGNITGGNLLGVHANGTSNVNIPAASGNVNISSAGTANVLVVTSTGVNVAGTLNTGSGVITTTGNITGGNILFGSGVVSGTGNITGGNIIGIIAAGANTITTTGNITGGNILFGSGVVSGTGNITGGNLIGIHAGGNSNVSIVANANINFGVTGTANVVSITAAGIITTAANAAISSNSFTATGAAFGNVNVAATLSNLGFRSVAATYTDTATLGTQANAGIHYLAIPTITGGTNAKTYTNFATLYIAGNATPGTNATITNNYAMFVASGNSLFSGTVSATVFNATSDRRLKKNIINIDHPLDIVANLNGVRYDWIDNNEPSAGLIAQDVEEAMPELVSMIGDGMKTINYNGIIGALVESVKQLNHRIAMLEASAKK